MQAEAFACCDRRECGAYNNNDNGVRASVRNHNNPNNRNNNNGVRIVRAHIFLLYPEFRIGKKITSAFVIARRNDEAIPAFGIEDCFASLAMTLPNLIIFHSLAKDSAGNITGRPQWRRMRGRGIYKKMARPVGLLEIKGGRSPG
jgi:hypothetical protein